MPDIKVNVDIPGVQTLSESTKDTVAGARNFLGHICMPAAEELGLLLKDTVRAWRGTNALKIMQKTANKYQQQALINEHAHPRLVHYALEEGSWTDDDLVQEMWAGLVTSSCTKTGRDDSNLLFMKVLSGITVSQAKIIEYACLNAQKIVSQAGWIGVSRENIVAIPLQKLQEISGIQDFHRLDVELDHLRSMEFLRISDGGFTPETTIANVTPTGLCLQFYVRCQGYVGSPVDYFGLNKKSA